MNMVDQRVSRKLLQEFMDYFYPAELKKITPLPQDIEDAALYSGVYRTNWHSHRTLEKLAVLGRDVLVTANPDRSLSISFENSPATRWIKTGENLFRNDSADEFVSFAVGESGNAYRLHQGSRPILAYEKIAWWETSTFHLLLQVTIVVIFFSFLLTTFFGRVLRKNNCKSMQNPKPARAARLLGNLASLLHPIFIIGFLAIQMKIVSGSYDILFYSVLTLPIILAVVSLIIAIFAVLAWKNSYWGLGGRMHYTLLAMAALANIWFLYYWNLIGYRV